MLDVHAVKQLYENMRAGAVTPSRAAEMRNSYGTSVLGSRGFLAWARTCAKLQVTTPVSNPLPRAVTDPGAAIDANYQLKNILTQMALRFVEGA